MLNTVTLMGRLTRDPELRYTKTSKPVTNFSIAVDRDFARDETDFVDVVAWNNTAEFVSKYFHKGALIAVSGRLQTREWMDGDIKRRAVEVVAQNVYFCERRVQTTEPDGGEEGLPF